jgi:hypothetical protein
MRWTQSCLFSNSLKMHTVLTNFRQEGLAVAPKLIDTRTQLAAPRKKKTPRTMTYSNFNRVANFILKSKL